MRLTFEPLQDDPRTIYIVASWNQAYWGTQYPDIFDGDDFQSEFEAHAKNTEDLPRTFIAKLNGEVAGVITIESEPALDGWDFSPWVSNLYVSEEARDQGVGNYLLEMALVKLKELNYEKAYIWTDASNEEYYTRRLWTAVAGSELGERRILVFEKTL
jgi:N-acetylglutamate synthase-like GNAT family acetyltransferase